MSKQVYKFEQQVKELTSVALFTDIQLFNLCCEGVVKTAESKDKLTHFKNRTQQVKFINNMPSMSLHICIGDYFFNRN